MTTIKAVLNLFWKIIKISELSRNINTHTVNIKKKIPFQFVSFAERFTKDHIPMFAEG